MDRAQLKLGTLVAAAALLAALLVAPAAGAALTAAAMYEPETVVAIDLQLPPASIEALEAEPEEYVQGTFELRETDGTPAGIAADPVAPGPLTVGVRLKGSGSFRDLSGKAAFKIKFNEFVKGQKFLGLKKLTLNNMVQDPSMVHEALSYEAFRAAGIAAPDAGYAYLELNGADYGLYLNLETMDDVALEKRFGPFGDPQHLYEGGPYVDVTPAEIALLEVDEGDEADIGDLEALAAAVVAESPGFLERLAPVADLEQMIRFWAAERYLGHWDGYSGPNANNYYLLSDAHGVFRMLPWGTDQTLVAWWYPFATYGGTMFMRCVAEPACFELYRADLAAVAQSTAALDLGARAQALAARLAPWQAREIADSARAEFSADAIAEGVGKVLDFLQRRPPLLEEWLAETAPPEPPRETPKPAEPVPPAAPAPGPAISGRLGLDRSLVGRGLLVARPLVGAAGTLALRARTGSAKRPSPACAARPKAVGAGAAVVSCRLTAALRRQLAQRPLSLQLELVLRPADGGEPVLVARTVRLARQAEG